MPSACAQARRSGSCRRKQHEPISANPRVIRSRASIHARKARAIQRGSKQAPRCKTFDGNKRDEFPTSSLHHSAVLDKFLAARRRSGGGRSGVGCVIVCARDVHGMVARR